MVAALRVVSGSYETPTRQAMRGQLLDSCMNRLRAADICLYEAMLSPHPLMRTDVQWMDGHTADNTIGTTYVCTLS